MQGWGAMTALPYVDAALLAERVPPAAAAAALRAALLGGLDPAAALARQAVPVQAGQLLLMPAEDARHLGVKLVTVAAAPVPGQPSIAGVYVLFDAVGLQPLAVIDGAALTALRTPAVSAVAVAELAAPDAEHLVLFGTGTQAWGHVAALRHVRPLRTVSVVGRDRERCQRFVGRVRDSELDARIGQPDAVRSADVVVCATTARTPLFDGTCVPDAACVVAVGSHERQARELDGALLGRAGAVVVEDVSTALREAGDVVLAVAEGVLDPADLVCLADLVAGRTAHRPGPTIFKSVGMGWQDLVVAVLAVEVGGPVR
jgi:ornithine cyclodeaminase/alanine dehydrogenase-like protein (mu-crystallin family)